MPLVPRFQIMTQTPSGITLTPLIATAGDAVQRLAEEAKEYLVEQIEAAETGGTLEPRMRSIIVTMVDE